MTMHRRTLLGAGAATVLWRSGPARAAGAPIRIGVLTDMDGPYSHLTGAGAVLGAQLAVQDFAAQHPDIPVELMSADFQLKPDVALSVAGNWFDGRGVDLLTDVPVSSAAIAIGEMARAKDKVVIINGAASSVLTAEKCSPNMLHWTYDTWSISNAVVRETMRTGGESWFFIAADYVFGRMLASDAAGFVRAAGGTVLGQVNHPFPGTTDFSAFLLQAKASGAKVIAFANAGNDMANCIKQAREFGIAGGGVKVVAVGLIIPDVVGLGLEAAQGTRWTEPYYWDMNAGTRAFAERFAAGLPNRPMPDAVQAGQYSSVRHYLNAVAAMGVGPAKASGRAVLAQMRAMPVNDGIFGESTIREDGRVTHPMYLMEAKAPSESRAKWDVGKVVGMLPAGEAFRPLNAGGCPLVKG